MKRWSGNGIVAYVDGDQLVVEMLGQTLRLAADAPVDAPPQPPTSDAGTLYRHPTGGEMRLPAGWQVTSSQLGLQLVPPDAAYHASGPSEIYLVNAQQVPGLARVDDPNVLAYVDGSLRQLVPTLQAPTPAAPCGKGIVQRWCGRHPVTGVEIQAVALLQLVDRAVTGIIGLGEAARITQRLPVLEQIFHSFERGERSRDPALAGVWHHWWWRGNTSHSSETRKIWLLQPDGRLVERSSHEGSVSLREKDMYGDDKWQYGATNQNTDGNHGTWSSGDGQFFVEWADGSSSAWQYTLQGPPGNRHLTLRAPGQKAPYEWTEQRVTV